MGSAMKKRIIISAVNFTEGGPLTVLRDCLAAASSRLGGNWEIIALVHDINLINTPNIRLIPFPLAKKSWFSRLYHEWYVFWKLSLKFKPDIWFSLHDITPWVSSKRRIVYCHNPSPFYKISWKEAKLDPSFFLFNVFYRYLYGIKIKKNHYVVVQQDWLRNEFKKIFNFHNIIVAHPTVTVFENLPEKKEIPNKFIFLYPSLPRVFKNIELICEASILLNKKAHGRFEVRLTIDGSENKYGAFIVKCYSEVPGVRFIGRQNRSEMLGQYAQCGCLIFPSRLETWGLPITEAKTFGEPILAADLPYAHETVGNYTSAAFFDPRRPEELACQMFDILEGRPSFTSVSYPLPDAPYASNWDTLLGLITEGL
jgi:glycosyltransferase involved in cell wall biosynthesis